MATKLFFGRPADGIPGIHRGTNTAKLNGSTSGWVTRLLYTTQGAGLDFDSVSTVTGATNGIEIDDGSSIPYEWISPPIDADTTISGTITLNLWALETAMAANAAINAIIERLDSQGAIASTIAQTARVTELGTAIAAENFTVSPTSTNMLKGDRIRARVYADDAGTMASGSVVRFDWAGATPGADGDSYISFTETFGFLTTEPSGSILYLTDTAGPAVGANIEKEMWTSRGAGVTSIVTNTAAGWTAPIQWTDSGGGTAVEWYSKPLTGFTLDGLVELNLRAKESALAANAGIRAELAICAGDGSGATVWAAYSLIDQTSPVSAGAGGGTDASGELASSEGIIRQWLAGDTTAVTDGQRLRLRVFLDDLMNVPLVTGNTATLYYNSTSGPASGDAWIQLPQSVTEFVASTDPIGKAIVHNRPAIVRAANW